MPAVKVLEPEAQIPGVHPLSDESNRARMLGAILNEVGESESKKLPALEDLKLIAAKYPSDEDAGYEDFSNPAGVIAANAMIDLLDKNTKIPLKEKTIRTLCALAGDFMVADEVSETSMDGLANYLNKTKSHSLQMIALNAIRKAASNPISSETREIAVNGLLSFLKKQENPKDQLEVISVLGRVGKLKTSRTATTDIIVKGLDPFIDSEHPEVRRGASWEIVSIGMRTKPPSRDGEVERIINRAETFRQTL